MTAVNQPTTSDNRIYYYIYVDETGTFQAGSKSAVAGYALKAERFSVDITSATELKDVNEALTNELINIISGDKATASSRFDYFHCGANSLCDNRADIQTTTLSKLWSEIDINDNFYIETFDQDDKTTYCKIVGKEAFFFKAPKQEPPSYSAAPELEKALTASDCYLQTLAEGLVSFFLEKTKDMDSNNIRLEVFVCQRQLATPAIDDSFNTKFGAIELPRYVISLVEAAQRLIKDDQKRSDFLRVVKFRITFQNKTPFKSEECIKSDCKAKPYEDILPLLEINQCIGETKARLHLLQSKGSELTKFLRTINASNESLKTKELKVFDFSINKLKQIISAYDPFIKACKSFDTFEGLPLKFDNIRIVKQNTNALKKAIIDKQPNSDANGSMPALLSDYIANSLFNSSKLQYLGIQDDKYDNILEAINLKEYLLEASRSDLPLDEKALQVQRLRSILDNNQDLYEFIKTLFFDPYYIPLCNQNDDAIKEVIKKAQDIFESSSYTQERLLNKLLEDLKPRCLQHSLAKNNISIIKNLESFFGDIDTLRKANKNYRVPFALELLILKFQCLSSINDMAGLTKINEILYSEFYKGSGEKPINEPRFSQMYTLYTVIAANVLYDNFNPGYKDKLNETINSIAPNDINPEYGKVLNTKILYEINEKLKKDHYLSPQLKKLYAENKSDSQNAPALAESNMDYLMKACFVNALFGDSLREKKLPLISLRNWISDEKKVKKISTNLNTCLSKYTSINTFNSSPELEIIKNIIVETSPDADQSISEEEPNQLLDYIKSFIKVQIFIRSYHLLEGIDLAKNALHNFKYCYPKDQERTYQVLSTIFVNDYPAIALLLLHKSILLTETNDTCETQLTKVLDLSKREAFKQISKSEDTTHKEDAYLKSYIKIFNFLFSEQSTFKNLEASDIDYVKSIKEALQTLSEEFANINKEIEEHLLEEVFNEICSHILNDSNLNSAYIFHLNIILQTLRFKQIRSKFPASHQPILWKSSGVYPQCLTYRYIVRLLKLDQSWTKCHFNCTANESTFPKTELNLLNEAQKLLTPPNCSKSFLWTSMRLSLLAEMLKLMGSSVNEYRAIQERGYKDAFKGLMDAFDKCSVEYIEYIQASFNELKKDMKETSDTQTQPKNRLYSTYLMNKLYYCGDIFRITNVPEKPGNNNQSDNESNNESGNQSDNEKKAKDYPFTSRLKNAFKLIESYPISPFDLQRIIDFLPY